MTADVVHLEKQVPTRSPIDALLASFTTNTERMHTLMGYPGVLLLFALVLVAVIAAPGKDQPTQLIYLAIASLVGSVLTYIADWYYNLQMSRAKAEMLRSYQAMLIEKFLPKDVRLQDVQAVINEIIAPMLGLEKK